MDNQFPPKSGVAHTLLTQKQAACPRLLKHRQTNSYQKVRDAHVNTFMRVSTLCLSQKNASLRMSCSLSKPTQIDRGSCHRDGDLLHG